MKKITLPIYQDCNITSDKICSFPFREMDIKSDGSVYCCAWSTACIGNIQLNTAKEIWHGELANEVRQSVVEKNYKFCKGDQCPWLNSPHEKGSPFVESPPELTDVPDVVNASYDKTCNMFCNSCRMFLLVDEDNRQRHEFLRQKIEDIGHVKELILIGFGDPFSSPHTRKWMSEGINIADKITIWSNGILLKSMWHTLSPITKKAISSIEISIDAATPETYNRIRCGGDWNVLMESMQFISELKSSGQIQNFRINFVVRAENYTEILDFIDLGNRFGVDDIYFSRMEDWGSISCNCVANFQVHKKTHKNYDEFLKIMEKAKKKDSKVRFGNLNVSTNVTS